MAKEKEPKDASVFKRKILDFKTFSKGKDTVQHEKLKPIKEGAEASTSRDEMIQLLHKNFPNVVAKKSEEFIKTDTNGICSAAENSSFIDNAKKISAFNPTDSYFYNSRLDKDYIEEVHKTLYNFLKEHGWYTEFYDSATPQFYPIWGANESIDEASEDNKFNYMMLSRLQSDCDYFLGNGNRSERNLWADNVDAHIKEMKRLWNLLPVKPEWLSMEDILDYEAKMKDSTNEKLTNDAKDFISKKIKKLIGEGRPQKQAVAMAYSYARKEGYDVPENESEIFESDMPSDELVKGKVYKIYDRNDNGKLYKSAARFDGPDGAKGNKFALVNLPVESYIWIKADALESFLFVEINYVSREEYLQKKQKK
jgi:hypothetical protein